MKVTLILAAVCLAAILQSNMALAQPQRTVTVDVNKNGKAPPSATVGVQVPIVQKKNTELNLGGSSTFQKGSKPNHNVGLKFTHKF